MSKHAVFLDRDGVINSYVYNAEFGTVDSPSNADEFQLKSGVPEAIAALRSMNMLVIVVSNQPGIAKGKFSLEILNSVTEKMHAECGNNIHDVFYCLHHPQATNPKYLANCNCRKPEPGLLLQAAAKWDIDLAESFMVGDSLTDIQAGRTAGTRTIYLGARKCYLCEAMTKYNTTPDYYVDSLSASVDIIRANNDKPLSSLRSSNELYGQLHSGSNCYSQRFGSECD
jgi:D-glycero-D-manno-heptose 1,7-bisphosphate phosphatase